MTVNRIRLAIAAGVVTIISMMFVDRPLEHALHSGYRRTAIAALIDRVFQPDPFLVLLFVIAAAAAVIQRRGRALPWWVEDMRAAGFGAFIAGLIAVGLKVVFGRSWPNPTYADQGIDEFRWFHGEWTAHYGAFPSATALIATAIATTLWQRRSPLRWVGVAIAVVFTTVVVIEEFHWLSDAIAGVGLGYLTASYMSARQKTRSQRTISNRPLIGVHDPLSEP